MINLELRSLVVGWKNGSANIFENLDLSVDFDSHSFLPILGRSGKGKSTLLYTIAALKWPVDGEVIWSFEGDTKLRWDKRGLNREDSSLARQRYFGFSFQDSTLLAHLTVEENLEYPLLLRGEGGQSTRKVRRVLDRLGLEEQAKKFPASLSGGQRQRVALAQAMVGDPYVLFADEPGGNLDVETKQEVLGLLREWVAEQRSRRAVIWITHSLDDPIELRAESAIFVNDGICERKDRSWLENCQASKRLIRQERPEE